MTIRITGSSRRTAITSLLSLVLLGAFLGACDGGKVDEKAEGELTTIGFEGEDAEALSRLDLDEEEIRQLELAKQGGLDGTTAAAIITSLHKRDLEFDIGMEMQTLSGAGYSPTALIKLVELGAVRSWEADLRVMKHAGIGESTILRIAERKFAEEKEDVLAGRDYERLKNSGMSDAGIEQFVEKKGTPQDVQKVEQAIRMGDSEQEAMKKAGM